jgi:ubiquinone/menaquinone biosynthesis C-methylase UbiE
VGDDFREAIWHAVPREAVPERFAARLALLQANVGSGDRVLDLGGGDGAFAAQLTASGCVVTIADVAEEALRRARDCAPAAALVRVEEGAALPFADAAFDVVWAGEVLEHVVDVTGLLAESRRVLRGGGLLVVTTPWHGRLVVAADARFDPRSDHLRFFSARTLGLVLRAAGFAQVRIRAHGLHGRWLSAIAR